MSASRGRLVNRVRVGRVRAGDVSDGVGTVDRADVKYADDGVVLVAHQQSPSEHFSSVRRGHVNVRWPRHVRLTVSTATCHVGCAIV